MAPATAPSVPYAQRGVSCHVDGKRARTCGHADTDSHTYTYTLIEVLTYLQRLTPICGPIGVPSCHALSSRGPRHKAALVRRPPADHNPRRARVPHRTSSDPIPLLDVEGARPALEEP
jgi:hypothetical protein